MVNSPPYPFNESYFKNYYHQPPEQPMTYNESWHKVSYLPHAVTIIKTHKLPVYSSLVLGSATGEPLEYLNLNNIKAYGIELSQWAQTNSLSDYKSSTYWGNINNLVPELAHSGQHFDFIFSQSLMYLPKNEIIDCLKLLSSMCKFMSHFGGIDGYEEVASDPLVITREKYQWWSDVFTNAGFTQSYSPYFWTSNVNSTPTNPMG